MSRGALAIAGLTLKEAGRRRLLLIVPSIAVIFLALYGVGNAYAFRELEASAPLAGAIVDARVLAAASLLGLATFVTLFLSAVLAVFLTMGWISGEAEQGLLQPLAVRPVPRGDLLTGRFLGTVSVVAPFALVVFIVAALITRALGGFWPGNVLLPALALALGVCFVSALSLLGSVFMGTVANGVVMFVLYGLALVGGLLGQVGSAIASDTLVSIARVISWALPFEALYQAGLYELTASTSGLTRVVIQLGPLGGAAQAGPGLWAWAVVATGLLLLAAGSALSRRDL